MIDGFKVFKYYTALRLHFTTPNFDVFSNRGRLKGSFDKFAKRNDAGLFEKVARYVKDDKTCIQFIAANFMYRNPDMIWNPENSIENYMLYLKRKQSITHTFESDLNTIVNHVQHNPLFKYSVANPDYSREPAINFVPDHIKLWLTDKISLETVVILNDFDDTISKMERSNQLLLLLGNDLLLIRKAKKFVKYNSYKVMSCYLKYIDEVYSKNGKDVSVSAI